MRIGVCPSCGQVFTVDDDVVIREIVECPECGQDLEISGFEERTVTFVVAELAGDDWGE